MKFLARLIAVIMSVNAISASHGDASAAAAAPVGGDADESVFRVSVPGYPENAVVLWVDIPLGEGANPLSLRSFAPTNAAHPGLAGDSPTDVEFLKALLGNPDAVRLLGDGAPWSPERVDALVKDKYLPRLEAGSPTAPFIVWCGDKRIGYGVLGILDGWPGVGAPNLVLHPSVYGKGYADKVGRQLLRIAKQIAAIGGGDLAIADDPMDAEARRAAFMFSGAPLGRLDMTVHPGKVDHDLAVAHGFKFAAPETPEGWEVDEVAVDLSGGPTQATYAAVEAALRELLDIGSVEGKRWNRIRNPKYAPIADSCGRFPVVIGGEQVTAAFVFPWDDPTTGQSGLRLVMSRSVGPELATAATE